MGFFFFFLLLIGSQIWMELKRRGIVLLNGVEFPGQFNRSLMSVESTSSVCYGWVDPAGQGLRYSYLFVGFPWSCCFPVSVSTSKLYRLDLVSTRASLLRGERGRICLPSGHCCNAIVESSRETPGYFSEWPFQSCIMWAGSIEPCINN